MLRHRFAPVLLATSCTVLPAFAGGDAKTPVPAASSGDWEFSISAGPAVRQTGTFGFRGGSRSGGLSIPSFVGGNSLTEPAIGSATDHADRAYDDGYVRQDPSTGIDGYTTYWGYQKSGQVNGDNLSMHATGHQSVRSDTLTLGNSPHVRRDERDIAPVIDFSGIYQREFAGFRFGFTGTLSWDSFDFDRHWSDFSLLQVRDDFRHDWTDRYNLGGVGGSIPSAPYNGTAAGPGFVLENLPDTRDFQSVLIGSDDALFTNHVSTRFRADHLTTSFGPTVSRQIDPSWRFHAGAGVSLHLIDWTARQTETLSISENGSQDRYARWKNSSSGTELLGGVYLQLGAEWTPVDKDWAIKSFFRKDFGMSFSERIGPSRISYDTDGYTAALMYSHKL